MYKSAEDLMAHLGDEDDELYLKVVEVIEAIPSEGLVAGQRGAVVYVHRAGEVYDVEFDAPGRNDGGLLVTLTRAQIRLVHAH